MTFRTFSPTEGFCQVRRWNIYTYSKLIFYMGNFSKNARLQKKNDDFYVILRNNKFNRDEIVEKRCSFQRSFYIQLPEITKCVESVKNEKLYRDEWKLSGSVSRLRERDRKWKKHWAVITNDSSLRGETSSVLFIVFYYKGIREIVRIKTVVTRR